MPTNLTLYPVNWYTEIRPRILKRADGKCEFCGLTNHSIVISEKTNGKTYWRPAINNPLTPITDYKLVKVILTIAHLDHDPQNHQIKDARLKALCQLCHLNYDRKHKQLKRVFSNPTIQNAKSDKT